MPPFVHDKITHWSSIVSLISPLGTRCLNGVGHVSVQDYRQSHRCCVGDALNICLHTYHYDWNCDWLYSVVCLLIPVFWKSYFFCEIWIVSHLPNQCLRPAQSTKISFLLWFSLNVSNTTTGRWLVQHIPVAHCAKRTEEAASVIRGHSCLLDLDWIPF